MDWRAIGFTPRPRKTNGESDFALVSTRNVADNSGTRCFFLVFHPRSRDRPHVAVDLGPIRPGNLRTRQAVSTTNRAARPLTLLLIAWSSRGLRQPGREGTLDGGGRGRSRWATRP